jgi:hypothetical protein
MMSTGNILRDPAFRDDSSPVRVEEPCSGTIEITWFLEIEQPVIMKALEQAAI